MGTIHSMDGKATAESADIANKIARLVEERGWNQEEFARITRLNRHTVRQILLNGERRLRNATTSACARALGLSVNDLRTLSLDQLLARMRAAEAAGNGTDPRHRLREESSHPELLAWVEQNPDRARYLTADEVDELLALVASGHPLTVSGIDRHVDRMERRRTVLHRVAAIAGSEQFDLLEQFVDLLYEKVKTRAERP
jgi:transcriptional regulator with XRE-family HTH domain